MKREMILRIISYWFAFGLGSLMGAWIVGAHPGSCSTELIELSTDQLIQTVQAALPAAATGSGKVEFKLDVTGIHVHADSLFKDQTFDATIPAVIRGSPMTLDVSSRLLVRLISPP